MSPWATRLLGEYRQRFGTLPSRLVHAPGRVNLIGEHIDYHDLSVLPMALERGIRVAFAPRSDGRVEVANAAAAFGPRAFELAVDPPKEPRGDWGNYVKAAAAAVVRRWGVPRGMRALVDADLPPAAGLSSSSALVVAVALALLEVNDVEADPLELAELMARGERYVGTEGGGMDQAVSLCGRKGHAVRIDFAPLRCEAVPVPGTWVVVVAHSGVEAEKSGRAQDAYNRLRKGGEAARRQVAGALGSPHATYRELLEWGPEGRLMETATRMLEPRLMAVFRHVVSEARRVAVAEDALRAADATAFGALLTASHASLRSNCGVSHPVLDAMVGAALEAGAHGARLTGAGFGGCMLALAGSDEAEAVEEALREAGGGLVFRAPAGGGAEVRRV